MNISNFSNTISSTQWSNIVKTVNSSMNSWSGVILGTSCAALMGLGINRWSESGLKNTLHTTENLAFKKVKERVSQAYGYVLGGFALTAAAAATAHINGISRLMMQNPSLSIPVFIGSIASLTATILVDKENIKTKHVAWAIFNLTMGMTLSPLGYLDQTIVAQAAAISLGLGGVVTLTAFLAPDKRFLKWEGPLMAALTTISIASTVALFFPATAFAYGVDRVSLYGGLAICTGLFMVSTQRLVEEAETQNEKTFDPINSSMNIYLDGLNIFVRILTILLENNKEEKKKD